jgi:hypothetical protein
MAYSLLQAIMLSQGLTVQEAKNEIADLVAQVENGEDLETALYNIGLEPDYIFDLLDAFAA